MNKSKKSFYNYYFSWTALVLALWLHKETYCFINCKERKGSRKTQLQLASCLHACFPLPHYNPHTLVFFLSVIQLFIECLRVLGTAHGTELSKYVVLCQMFLCGSAMFVFILRATCLSRRKERILLCWDRYHSLYV